MLWRGFDFGYTGSALSGGIKVKSHTIQWERAQAARATGGLACPTSLLQTTARWLFSGEKAGTAGM